jgi:hypothetical protein
MSGGLIHRCPRNAYFKLYNQPSSRLCGENLPRIPRQPLRRLQSLGSATRSDTGRDLDAITRAPDLSANAEGAGSEHTPLALREVQVSGVPERAASGHCSR